jgi:hypothetical protein
MPQEHNFLLRFPQCAMQKTVLVMPDAIAAADRRYHDLGIVSKLLAREGFKIVQMSPEPYLAAASDSTRDEELWASLEVMSASHGLTSPKSFYEIAGELVASFTRAYKSDCSIGSGFIRSFFYNFYIFSCAPWAMLTGAYF